MNAERDQLQQPALESGEGTISPFSPIITVADMNFLSTGKTVATGSNSDVFDLRNETADDLYGPASTLARLPESTTPRNGLLFPRHPAARDMIEDQRFNEFGPQLQRMQEMRQEQRESNAYASDMFRAMGNGNPAVIQDLVKSFFAGENTTDPRLARERRVASGALNELSGNILAKGLDIRLDQNGVEIDLPNGSGTSTMRINRDGSITMSGVPITPGEFVKQLRSMPAPGGGRDRV